MPNFLDRLSTFAETIASGPLPRAKVLYISPEQCFPPATAGRPIHKDADYFSIRVNEIGLAEGRHLWQEYEPMVLVISEFIYAGKRTTVPFVVGPGLLKKTQTELPRGMVYSDILVAGPHPFRGGNVAITLILYKIKRENYARGLLQVLEGISSAVGAPADIAMLARVGNTVLDGLGVLLNMRDTVPLIGHRVDVDTTTGFDSRFCLLSSHVPDVDFSSLQVRNGQLIDPLSATGEQHGAPRDYILYSINSAPRRADETTLSFHPLYKQARDAIFSGKEGWTRARSILLTLYQHMLNSDDLVPGETEELFQKFKNELVAIKTRREEVAVLSRAGEADGRSRQSQIDNRTAEILSL
jgi:hypothetical protein